MHALLRTLFPQLCPGCHRVLQTHTALCEDCIPREAHLTHLSVLRDTQEPHLVYLGPPEGKLRRLVHALKYHHNQGIASCLAPALGQAIPQEWHLDVICPVPLHPRRLQERGYNQSELLARALSGQVQVPTRNLLRRTTYTHQQARLHARDRQHNLQGAFAANAPIRGLRVLLVDDVLSTGATLQACTRVLQTHQAHSIHYLVMAR